MYGYGRTNRMAHQHDARAGTPELIPRIGHGFGDDAGGRGKRRLPLNGFLISWITRPGQRDGGETRGARLSKQ
ncbi:Uncharacterised protein [Mycobacteroides abscessus subsp. abscessus]|nr:Uncharacterised protein [Mycobacteroides abscessus subsp. abscessus]